MVSVTQYAVSVEGALKFIHILFGAVTIGCTIPSADTSYKFETAFLVASAGCFLVSLVCFPLAATAAKTPGRFKYVDSLYHVVMGILLIVTSSMMLSSAVKNKVPYYCWPGTVCEKKDFNLKVSGGTFGLINGILYLLAAVTIARGPSDGEARFNAPYQRPPA